jgi:hypothetical protein
LPKVSIADFMKAIAHISGLFFIRGENENEIVLTSVKAFFDNKQVAPDWSKKLIKITNIKYSYFDAQENILQYKARENSNNRAAGSLLVNDETLTRSKELVTLPFATTDDEFLGLAKMRLILFLHVKINLYLCILLKSV